MNPIFSSSKYFKTTQNNTEILGSSLFLCIYGKMKANTTTKAYP